MRHSLPIFSYIMILTVIGLFGPGYSESSTEAKATAKELNVVAAESFDKGYAYFESTDYENAAPYLYDFIRKNTVDTPDYEWALFFLGISLKKEGFSHAAVDSLSYLVTRKPNPKIVNYTLELFEKISKEQPFDHEEVIEKAICDQDYNFVEKNIADFINYHQGIYDWEHGFVDWGEKHFQKIRKGTYYYYKYRFQKAIYAIQDNDINTALSILKEIEENNIQEDDIKDEARKTKARLLYELENYQGADFAYTNISTNVVHQATNLLERAWCQYRLGNYEKAMGLLYAFEAPIFQKYITPEFYLLKSLIYKNVCHYQSALNVVNEFRNHYGDVIQGLYKRKNIKEQKALLLMLLEKQDIKKTWEFVKLLEIEKKKCRQIEDKPLKAYLEQIYNLELDEQIQKLNQQIEDEFENVANALLAYEEKSNLMTYEIGLDMYQRVVQYHYKDGLTPRPETDEQGLVYYRFQGEFWNDELSNFNVTLQDKCGCMEEWDIFFK